MSDHTTGGTDESRKSVAAHPSPQVRLLVDSMKVVAWQAHSVRGYLSTAAKKHRIKIESTKTDSGERTYRIAN
jgi:hypothetical protein